MENLVLQFLNNENNCEENYQNLIQFLNDLDIKNNHHELSLFLHLIEKIAKRYYHTKDFFAKIDKIIAIFLKEIKKYFSNMEIFNIFKGSKRILLFLIENKILILNKDIISIMLYRIKYNNYIYYFAPEIKPFYDDLEYELKQYHLLEELLSEIPPNFYQNRIIGENESRICEIIRNDSIGDFITYVNKTNLSLNSKIEISIFDTNIYNNCQIFNYISIIEYAVFFGSIQIIKYLFENGVEFSSSLLIDSMHNQCQELIDLLETKNTKPKNENDEHDLLYYSIKYHNINMINYMKNNYFDYVNKNEEKYFIMACKNYHFAFFEELQINETYFYSLCKYNFNAIIRFFIKNTNFDINSGPDIPLNVAIKNNNIDMVKDLLSSNRIDINKVSKYDMHTALTIALDSGYVEIVKLLLSRNDIDVNIEYIKYAYHPIYEVNTKYSPLSLAIGKNIEIVKLLLSKDNIDPNVGETYETDYGEHFTPLCKAICGGYTDVVRLLLNKDNIDVNRFSIFYDKKQSPLCFAIKGGEFEIVKLLLECEDIVINYVMDDYKITKSAIKLMHENDNKFNEDEKKEIISLLETKKIPS